MKAQLPKDDCVLYSDPRHFGDQVTDRCHAADECALVQTDSGIQPQKAQSAVPQHRCYRVIG